MGLSGSGGKWRVTGPFITQEGMNDAEVTAYLEGMYAALIAAEKRDR